MKGEVPRCRREVWEKDNGTGSRTRKNKRSTTGSGVAKGQCTGRWSKTVESATVSTNEKRDIATGRKREKEEVPQREGLRKGKCHKRRSKKGTVQKAEGVRR